METKSIWLLLDNTKDTEEQETWRSYIVSPKINKSEGLLSFPDANTAILISSERVA